MDVEREIADAQVGRVSLDPDADDHLAQIVRRERMVRGADGWDGPDSSGDRRNPQHDCSDSGGDSKTFFAPVKRRGLTPMIVSFDSLSVIVWPSAAGDRPNSRLHKLSLITATSPKPDTASSDG